MKERNHIDLILSYTSLIKYFHDKISELCDCIIKSFPASVKKRKRCVLSYKHMIYLDFDMSHTIDCRCQFILKGPYHSIQYLLTGKWLMQFIIGQLDVLIFDVSGPVFGGLAALLSSLSFL